MLKITQERSRGVLEALGDQAVGGVGLVGGAGEQAVVEQAEALRRLALEDEGVEAVEGLAGAGAAEAHGAALRRVGVHVVEVREAVGVLEVAEGRDAVADDDLAGVGRGACRRGRLLLRRGAAGGERRGRRAKARRDAAMARSCGPLRLRHISRGRARVKRRIAQRP